MNESIKIISFDLDGVLFDGPSAAFLLAQHLGLSQKFMEVYAHVAKDKKGLEDSIREGSKIWKGIPADETYEHLIMNMPLMKGAGETIHKLKEQEIIIGCISSGVSQFFMKPFAKRLDLDFAYSNILGETNGAHDGTVKYVMGGKQKAETALKVVKEHGLNRTNLASVGDGANDIALFKVSALSVAFNPESDAVSHTASVTVHSKDLRSILEFF